ncbi:AAA family ATPase [Streptomyces sp. MUM 136J]|uniref:LuxR C-terminal-related transcriptional regulator n=1 Tax=Streptomyces sp. MUM 136J TaxID=2791992 RepID=UPI001F03A296|nr:LuxR family transcriptional regulator [Streptomyces sp. MUM 136J]MCH0573323.1 AAA family ATPase [Streptomyces sp. MUM 136J]
MVPTLLGRARERDTLYELLERPGGASVLLRGGFGSGKSGLLADLGERARAAGFAVFSACYEPAASHRPQAAPSPAVCSLVPEGGGERAVAFVRWLASGDAAPPADGMLSGARSAPMQRVLVLADDLQWADAVSLRGLRSIARAVGAHPVTVVCALGPGESVDESALGAVLRLLDHHVRLSPLDESAVADRLGEILDASEDGQTLAEVLHPLLAAAAGNQYLIRTLLGAADPQQHGGNGRRECPPLHTTLTGAFKPLLADVGVAARAALRRIGADAERVAAVLASLGSAQLPEVIAHAGAMDRHTVEDALHALAQAELVQHAEVRAQLHPPLLAAGLALGISPTCRKRHHARAAELLLGWGAPAEQVAPHLVHGPAGMEQATAILRRAAQAALDRGAPDEAVIYLRRTLSEDLDTQERSEVLTLIGAARLDSDVPAAVPELRSSLRLGATPQALARSARSLTGALFAMDRYGEALTMLEGTIRRLRTEDAAAALRLELDYLLVSLGEAASAVRAWPRLMELRLRDADDDAGRRALAALLSFRGAALGQGAEDVIELARVGLSRGMAPVGDESIVYPCAVLALGAAGRPDLTFEYADAAVAETRARASALSYAQALSTRANAQCRRGAFADARTDAQHALAAFRDIGVDHRESHSVFAVATLAEAFVRQGQTQKAEALFGECDLSGPLGFHTIYDYPLLVRGWVHAADNRLERALADFLHLGERLNARGMPGPGFYPWRSEAALVHLLLGDRQSALTLADEELRLARTWGVAEMTAVALRGRALVVGHEEGLELLDEAARLLGGDAARFRYAQIQADRGTLAVRYGRPEDARAALQEAVSVAHECGAQPIAQQARAGLRELGDRPRTPTFRGREALTPAQRQVAELAAQGMTNTEIASHLFVGLRTVEMHLSKVYAKLAVRGRHALEQALR